MGTKHDDKPGPTRGRLVAALCALVAGAGLVLAGFGWPAQAATDDPSPAATQAEPTGEGNEATTTEGEAPAEGETPSEGEAPAEGETPPEGEGGGEGPPGGAGPPDLSHFGYPDTTELSPTLTGKAESSGAALLVWVKILLAVLGVIILALVALLAWRELRNRQRGAPKRKPTVFNVVMGSVSALLVAAMIAANALANTYSGALNNVFTQPYSADANIETREADWRELTFEIAAEGMTLLRNENGALPLDSSGDSAKINLLGYSAYAPIYSGGGSSAVSAADAIDVVSSLEDAGVEINPAPLDAGVYKIQTSEDQGLGFDWSSFETSEVPVSSFAGEASFDNLKAYSDTAVVVIGRTGREGGDLPGANSGETNYLELTADEKSLLEKARDTFGKLVVVVNSGNAIEMGFVEDYSVDAVVWAGLPGPYGFGALGPILTGEVNPSAKLPDTWVYDNDSAPANENYGDHVAANAENSHYVDYVEGIYVGYKWYETAYAEGAVTTNTKTKETFDYANGYDGIVAYPFGYGLSYTTFEQKVTGGSLKDGGKLEAADSYSVEVEVTNTGSAAGKEVVQLYLTAPYTDYDITNGVEKAAVSLIGFAKTGLLEPGASETVTVEFDMEDIASYDATYDNGDGTNGAYMLDVGDYEFSIRADAHTAYESVTANLGDQHFFSGEDQRTSDDQAAYNQFADAARGEYLSRNGAFANYASAMGSVSADVKSTAYEDDPSAYDPAYDEAVTKKHVKGVDYAADGELTLEDMIGVPYDDDRWAELISQLTLEELQSLVVDATYVQPALPSIGTVRTLDTDGALGISSAYNAGLSGIAYPCIPLLAATFNVDLAREMGNQMADQSHSRGVTGWYAPAMDTHRSAYSGRNFEYFSEDGYLAGAIGAAETLGCREKGLVVYIKHFALNDQETNRGANLHTYSNEQAIREIYLKPFELSVKDGGATAVMSAMNFIGDTYIPTHEPLLIQVLRNEWGMRGKTLTDMTGGSPSVDAALRAGTDAWLTIDSSLAVRADTDADIYYLQRTAHNILSESASATTVRADVLNWRLHVNLFIAELGLLLLISLTALVLRNRRQKPSGQVVEPAEG
ncbi:MAG: glycoside hydrolase family 3 C-terminal domain-containing protein [Bifidobacteriaceae bacterium]|jgi:beta-glucosidase|nr:glycoside hydrolase family 3 C-terminal domain-containing protein [Bifidobacteriaceae bacterium]